MDRLKRFIDCAVPVNTCNLRCPYCYITQKGLFSSKLPTFPYSAEHIGKCLSKERLGGICHINMCGNGETLLPPEITEIIRQILQQGHYVFIVTNGTVKKRFEEIATFPSELLKRLGFKFSFHYTELLRTNKLERFFDNVRKMRKAGCSFSVELTPYDELIPHIEAIHAVCRENIGASCHVTVARDNTQKTLPILSDYGLEEYRDKWKSFASALFDFKMSTFYVKRKEFCHAGDWSLLLNLADGDMTACYGHPSVNIFKDPEEPIPFSAIGTNCQMSHCYNSHSFMTLGIIPSVSTPTYAAMRNRVCEDGTEWLNPEMKAFLSQKLADNNEEYGDAEKEESNRLHRINRAKKLTRKIKKLARKIA